jgi:hypothetical protein
MKAHSQISSSALVDSKLSPPLSLLAHVQDQFHFVLLVSWRLN